MIEAKTVIEEKEYQEDILTVDQIERLKSKYGKVYSITSEIMEDDENSREVQYIFQKPKTASYDRYLKTASKGMTKALQAFLLDNIVSEQRQKLIAEMEEYPAFTLGIGQKLLAVLGLSENVNLQKL